MKPLNAITFLSELVARKPSDIINALASCNDYQITKTAKKGGGFRTIYQAPAPLKLVQENLDHFFRYHLKIDTTDIRVYGIKGYTSHFNHARAHSWGKYIFQFDLKNAFGSADIKKISDYLYRLLKEASLSFQEIVNYHYVFVPNQDIDFADLYYSWPSLEKFWPSYLKFKRDDDYHNRKHTIFSRFPPQQVLRCVRDENHGFRFEFALTDELLKAVVNLIIKLTTCNNILPQGTATAPLFYLIAIIESGLYEKLDLEGRAIDRDHWVTVTAYVDNFTASSWGPIPKAKRQKLLTIVKDCGWQVNPKKTHYQKLYQGEPTLTGINIDGQGNIKLPKKTVKKIRGILHRALSDDSLVNTVYGLMGAYKPLFITRDNEIHIPKQLQKPWQEFKNRYPRKHYPDTIAEKVDWRKIAEEDMKALFSKQ